MDKVLIVDDESLVIKSLIATVNWNEYGFEIAGEANNGIEALEIITQTKPCVVFTDIRMPGMSGLELIKKVNELSLDVIFVVISGYAEFAYAQKAVSYGVLGYCLKPFDDVEITNILKKARKLIDKSKASVEAELLTLLEDGDPGSIGRKERIFQSLGFEWDAKDGMYVLMSLGANKIKFINGVQQVSLKIGKNKHIYFINKYNYEKLKPYLDDMTQNSTLSIGVSKKINNAGDISKAIEEAYIAANQFFMLGNRGVFEYRDCEQEELNKLLVRLENSIVSKDTDGMSKVFGLLERLFWSGNYNIRHAFQVYHIVTFSFDTLNSERYENFIYNFEQLTASFTSMKYMLESLKKNLAERFGIKNECMHSGIKNETFRNILAYVDKHYCEDISIQSIAQEFTINPSYVSQLFKKETGVTFTEYLTNLRIRHAGNLLKTTVMTINDIAEKSGFSDYYYFTRVFKKATGKTPTLFRENS